MEEDDGFDIGAALQKFAAMEAQEIARHELACQQIRTDFVNGFDPIDALLSNDLLFSIPSLEASDPNYNDKLLEDKCP